MRLSVILRLVMINLFQNKFKVILTSIGIVVGAATIVMVIAIGRGGQMDVADQFKNLNAGAIDISYEQSMGNQVGQGGQGGGMPSGGGFPPTMSSSTGNGYVSTSSQQQSGQMPQMPEGFDPGAFFGTMGGNADNRINRERIILSDTDVDDLEVFVPGVSAVTISYTTRTSVNGGDLEEDTTYTIAGVKSDYAELSNLELTAGDFLTQGNSDQTEKVCVLGADAAVSIFGSVNDAYDSILYIDNRPYVVNGILESMGSVSSGISPDESVFIPYETGIKYITGQNISSTITAIASDVDDVPAVIENIKTVLSETYPNAEFTIEDAGSKMEAASASNETLTLLLFAMAAIVFVVGGIGIMNVLFVSVKERTKEIGILKSIGCRKRDILLEFLFEASFISVVGGFMGAGISILITPLIELFSVRIEHSLNGFVLSVLFAIFTGSAFGFYPAFKASHLIPVEALNTL